MTPRDLAPRDRRALGVGVAVFAALLLIGRGAPALLAATSDARAAALAATREASDADHLVSELAARGRGVDTILVAPDLVAASIFHAASDAGLASTLAAHVEQAADSASVRLLSLRAASRDSTPGSLRRIIAKASGECDVDGLATLLATLERMKPIVRVTKLGLVAADIAAGSQRPEILRFDLQVEALGAIEHRAP